MCYTLYSQLFTISFLFASTVLFFLPIDWGAFYHQRGYFHLLRFLCCQFCEIILQMEMNHLSRKATYLSIVVNRIDLQGTAKPHSLPFTMFMIEGFSSFYIIIILLLNVVMRPLCVCVCAKCTIYVSLFAFVNKK